jgi:ribosomal protein S18 acetylase RimI-like enzyme
MRCCMTIMKLQPASQIAPFVTDVTSVDLSLTSTDVALPLPLMPWLLIRRLGHDDRTALKEHFIGLPREDRRTRFGGNTSDEAIRRHCDDLNLDETVCFAAVDATGEIVEAAFGFTYQAGVGHPFQLAEIALSVAPAHRRRGLGANLVARVCDTVATRGAEAAVFEFDPSNAAIRGLIRHLGGRVTPFADSCTIPLSTLH